MKNKWLKQALFLVSLFLLALMLPNTAVDKWNLFNLKKIVFLVFALASIQMFGLALNKVLGKKNGALLSGFCGGLLSSTATTAALARKSKVAPELDVATESLTFLAATLAMLIEAASLVIVGGSGTHYTLLIIFGGPIVLSLVLIFKITRNFVDPHSKFENSSFSIGPLLRLSAFVLVVLGLSKLLQVLFGKSGLLVLTFLVSLFEIHGSVIANIQLHDSGGIGLPWLGSLLAISVAASYISKLFLIHAIGSSMLFKRGLNLSLRLLLALLVSWLAFFLTVIGN